MTSPPQRPVPSQMIGVLSPASRYSPRRRARAFRLSCRSNFASKKREDFELNSANPMVVCDVPCAAELVVIQDPAGRDPAFRHSTLGRLKSMRMLAGRVLLYRCVLPAGDQVLVPAGYVSQAVSAATVNGQGGSSFEQGVRGQGHADVQLL